MLKLLLTLGILCTPFSVYSKTESNQTVKMSIDSKNSRIHWLGKKRFVPNEHDGTVTVKEGFVLVEGDTFSKAEITIDMTTIINLDQKDKKYNAMLVEHLNSDDFFDVDKHPTAKLVIESVSKKSSKDEVEAKGTLTVRGISEAVSLKIKLDEISKTKSKASGVFVFDRNKFGVKYRSKESWFDNTKDAAKDKIIDDMIKITFTISANK